MNIIVCVKQVPDTLDVGINSQTNTLIREGADGVINPFDLHALEEGLRLTQRYGGKVTALSMGPLQAKSALREAISLGADEAFLLSDVAFAGADTLATSYALARGVKTIGPFDLIICGQQAVDGDTAHIGPQLAERLGIPHASCIAKTGDVADGFMVAERLTEDGAERIRLLLPGLITVTKEINKPRFPSLSGKIRAAKSEITVWSARDIGANSKSIGLNGSPTRVITVSAPDHRRQCEMLEGAPQKQASDLLARLADIEVLRKGIRP